MTSDGSSDTRFLDASLQEIVLDPNWEQFSRKLEGIDQDALHDSYRRLQLIYTLGRAIMVEASLEKVFDAVLVALVRMVDLERCFVATFDDRGVLRARASYNMEIPENAEDLPVSKTVIRRVIEEGVGLLSSDALQDGRLTNIESLNLWRTRSLLCVPTGPKNLCRGVIYADSRVRVGTFTELDLLFVTALSHYVDLGIQNASAMEEASAARALSDERLRLIQQDLARDQEVVGASPKLVEAYGRLGRAAKSEVPILLLGESGTGKDVFARAAHRMSERALGTFMVVNIAALSENLVESELFGHEKGAFSGADARRIGRLELARGGTLFLDEVGDIPMRIQPKLLRFLETGEFERVGGTDTLRTDIRLICATNRDLAKAVKDELFREDLYFRLTGVTVDIPPLRERVEDIPDLVGYFLREQESSKTFSEPAMRLLKSYSWPGNVRELARVVQAIDALCPSSKVSPADLPEHLRGVESGADGQRFLPLPELISRVERDHISFALGLTGGNNERAIEMLGIARSTFFERKKRFGL